MVRLNLGEDQPKLPPLWPSVGGIGGAQVLQLSPCSTCVEILCQHHLATFHQKRDSRPTQVIFHVAMSFYQPLCKTLKRLSRIWFLLRSGLLWIVWRQWNDLINCNGPLKKHIKSFGMPCRIKGGLNGNGHLGTWKKPQTWPTMTFLTKLTWLGGSKVLLWPGAT